MTDLKIINATVRWTVAADCWTSNFSCSFSFSLAKKWALGGFTVRVKNLRPTIRGDSNEQNHRPAHPVGLPIGGKN